MNTLCVILIVNRRQKVIVMKFVNVEYQNRNSYDENILQKSHVHSVNWKWIPIRTLIVICQVLCTKYVVNYVIYWFIFALSSQSVLSIVGLAEEIRKTTGNAEVLVRQLDVSNLQSVRDFASKIILEEPTIHILVPITIIDNWNEKKILWIELKLLSLKMVIGFFNTVQLKFSSINADWVLQEIQK